MPSEAELLEQLLIAAIVTMAVVAFVRVLFF
jgi:hypothetical protein